MKTRTLGIMGLGLGYCLTPVTGIELGDDMGSILLDTRVRYESADLETLDSSSALTGRIRAGYQSGDLHGFNVLVELETTIPLDEDNYDAYPGAQGTAEKTIIADPRNFQLNRAQLSWTHEYGAVAIGRQRIIRNNARFIGNVGWRQNEQTYDAVSVDFKATDAVSLYYAYLDRAHRIFGSKADVKAQREFEMTSHVLEAQYKANASLSIGTYAYLLGIVNSPASASDTVGLWASGSGKMDEELSLVWRGELAQQEENSYSPSGAKFSLSYYHLTAGLKKNGLGTLSIGYESLEGDGSRGFSTPLATLHAFNGFADVFLSTPSTGLKDFYLKAAFPIAEGITGTLFVHKFEADMGSIDYGQEIDLVLGYKLNKNLSVTGKLALFEGDTKPDITRFWIQLDGKF